MPVVPVERISSEALRRLDEIQVAVSNRLGLHLSLFLKPEFAELKSDQGHVLKVTVDFLEAPATHLESTIQRTAMMVEHGKEYVLKNPTFEEIVG